MMSQLEYTRIMSNIEDLNWGSSLPGKRFTKAIFSGLL